MNKLVNSKLGSKKVYIFFTHNTPLEKIYFGCIFDAELIIKIQ